MGGYRKRSVAAAFGWRSDRMIDDRNPTAVMMNRLIDDSDLDGGGGSRFTETDVTEVGGSKSAESDAGGLPGRKRKRVTLERERGARKGGKERGGGR